MQTERQWIIESAGQRWNTDIGWVKDHSLATVYSHQKHGYVILPLGGRWKELKHEEAQENPLPIYVRG